jgi:single-strand DNA-binding protein
MAGYQSITILGYLGHDPELHYTPTGAAVANFSVAVDHHWTSSDGTKQKETEWFHVVTWNRLAEACGTYLHKGSPALVVGRLKTRSWDGQDGHKHDRTELIAETVQFLSRAPTTTPANADAEPDDAPF